MPLNSADRTAPAPKPFASAFTRSKGQRGYSPIRFLGSLRGQGTLAVSGRRRAVTYQLDQYENSAGRTGSGALEGSLGSAAAGDQARLRLEDGREVDVTLQETDADGAVFGPRGACSTPAPAPAARRAKASA